MHMYIRLTCTAGETWRWPASIILTDNITSTSVAFITWDCDCCVLHIEALLCRISRVTDITIVNTVTQVIRTCWHYIAERNGRDRGNSGCHLFLITFHALPLTNFCPCLRPYSEAFRDKAIYMYSIKAQGRHTCTHGSFHALFQEYTCT